MDDDQDSPPASTAALEALTVRIDEFVVRAGTIETDLSRLDKIEEDIATLARHIGEIKETLAEIADTQQAQARQVAGLAARVAGAEQTTTAVQLTMTAYEERVRQVASSMRELRRATQPTG